MQGYELAWLLCLAAAVSLPSDDSGEPGTTAVDCVFNLYDEDHVTQSFDVCACTTEQGTQFILSQSSCDLKSSASFSPNEPLTLSLARDVDEEMRLSELFAGEDVMPDHVLRLFV